MVGRLGRSGRAACPRSGAGGIPHRAGGRQWRVSRRAAEEPGQRRPRHGGQTAGIGVSGHRTARRRPPDLRLALREFEQQLRQRRGVGLFYYAGNGVQLKGQNYLIPIGADIRQEFEVPDEGVDADIVLRAMESAGNELNIVILDACRNNPFTGGFGGSRGWRGWRVRPGTFIAYATAPGAVSQDGASRNSPTAICWRP